MREEIKDSHYSKRDGKRIEVVFDVVGKTAVKRVRNSRSARGNWGQSLQLVAVQRARTEKLPFWANFDSRDRFARNSMSFVQIELKPG